MCSCLSGNYRSLLLSVANGRSLPVLLKFAGVHLSSCSVVAQAAVIRCVPRGVEILSGCEL